MHAFSIRFVILLCLVCTISFHEIMKTDATERAKWNIVFDTNNECKVSWWQNVEVVACQFAWPHIFLYSFCRMQHDVISAYILCPRSIATIHSIHWFWIFDNEYRAVIVSDCLFRMCLSVIIILFSSDPFCSELIVRWSVISLGHCKRRTIRWDREKKRQKKKTRVK